MTDQSSFLRAADDVTHELLNNDKVLVHTSFMGLLGSVNSGEAVAGWSDLDLLFILDSSNDGTVSPITLEMLKKMHRQVQKNYPQIPISFLTHTLHDLENYVSYDYLLGYMHATPLYTRSTDRVLIDSINDILTNREIDSETMKRQSIYSLRHMRFNLLRKYVSWSGDNIDLARLVADKLIQSSLLVLAYSGDIQKSKKTNIEMSCEFVGDERVTDCLLKCYEFREAWPNVQSQTEDIIMSGLSCLEIIVHIMQEKYSHPTPETQLSKKVIGS